MKLVTRAALARPWGPAFWRSYYRKFYPGRQPADLAVQGCREEHRLALLGQAAHDGVPPRYGLHTDGQRDGQDGGQPFRNGRDGERAGHVQGVGAVSDAYFNANCGASGHSEAYAYTRATLNGVTSTHSVFSPKDGVNIRSDASWSLQGGPDCYSQASGSVNSVSLGISYSVFDENYQCPPPPVNVTINGPSYASIYGYDCQSLTWTASASGGTSPYSYQWYIDGYPVGTGTSYSDFYCGSNYNWWQSFTVSVTVTDAASAQDSDSRPVSIDYYQDYNNCNQDPYRLYELCPYEVDQR